MNRPMEATANGPTPLGIKPRYGGCSVEPDQRLAFIELRIVVVPRPRHSSKAVMALAQPRPAD